MRLCTFMTPQKILKTLNLIKIGFLWVWKNLWGYGRKVHAKILAMRDALGPDLSPFWDLMLTLIFLILDI